MLRKEAQWLAQMIYSLDEQAVFPLLNLGSSNQNFRTKEQPWIDEYLFKPARSSNHLVIHADLKPENGVDLVGDLSDPLFLTKIAELQIQSVLCSNLLEHVINKEEICQTLSSILPMNGYLFITVPYQFPLHLDPIDTLFRPNINELRDLFPNLTFIAGAIIEGGKLVKSTSIPSFLYFMVMIIRLLFPLYQPLRWLNSLRYSLWLFKDISATCIVLQKTR